MTDPVTGFAWPFTHVTETVQVKAEKGQLHSIVVNGLTTAGDITVRDDPAGAANVIAILHLDPTTSVSVQPITFLYDAKLKNGLHLEYDQTVVADLSVMSI